LFQPARRYLSSSISEEAVSMPLIHKWYLAESVNQLHEPNYEETHLISSRQRQNTAADAATANEGTIHQRRALAETGV